MTTPQPPRAFCCEPMRGYSTAKCQEHRDEPALCSDVLVVHSERHGPGLPIHVDGGGGMIVIEFCPWCGTRIGDGAGTATPAEEEWDQSFKTRLAYSRLLRGMARRTAILRGKLLDETLPDRGVVTAVAVARTPREPESQDDRLRTEIMLAQRAAEKTADIEGNLPLSWVRTILERIELMGPSTPPSPRPHAQRRVWKGEDGKDQHGPWHPCPTCPQEVVRQSASELDRTTFPPERIAAEEPGVLWMAMRYALGRATYAVGEVGDAIERHADSLEPGQRQRMAAEIAAAIAEGRAGMDMDVAVWRRAVHRLVGEEPGRALLAGGEQP